MKFALVDGRRQKAQPKLLTKCRVCGHPMIAKCGEERLREWNWAHKMHTPVTLGGKTKANGTGNGKISFRFTGRL